MGSSARSCCTPVAPAAPTSNRQEPRCPTCGQIGKSVGLLTLKAMLALPLTVLQDQEYRFCRTPDCPTVYYSVDGTQTFQEKDLRERVFQKHPAEDDIFVCYCFRHTLGSIKAEMARSGTTMVIAEVMAAVREEKCACDIRNPQGTCCLGNLQAVVQYLARAR